MNQKLIDTLLNISDTTMDAYTKKHINHLVDCIILGNQEKLNHNKLSASEILKKHEDLNEMHLHDVDRKWVIESMEEYAQQSQSNPSKLVEALEKIANECTSNEVSISFIEHEARQALESYKDGWVSVKDRLPENGIRVLICCKELNQIQVTGYCWDMVWNLPNFIRKGTVTHWQPIPSPPQPKTI